jgi:hypothetical protein
MLPDSFPPPVRDSFYACVGFPVVAADELARLAQRWAERVPTVTLRPLSFDEVGGAVDARVRAVEERLAELDKRVEDVLDRVQAQLPDTARGAVSRTRTQLRTLVPSRS